MAEEYSPNATLFVLNRNFVQFYAISEFVSLIWTERYWSYGDFELELLYDLDVLDNVKVGHYIALGGSENIMVIESLSITYEIDNKSARYIIYKGRTMESILDRRIVWGEWLYEEIDAQAIILDLIEKCIIAPEDAGRKIPFFRAVSNDQIPEYKLTLYGDGNGLYEIVQSICQEKQIGMRCRLIENAKVIEFSLYSGLDHSYDQLERAPVIFSGEYENLGPSRYALDTSKYKTCALVVSPWRDTTIRDEEGNVVETETTRSVVEVGDFSLTGLDRREMLVESGSGYPDDMVREAMEEIADINRLEELDSELDPKRQFVYGVDYDIGDTVQVVTEFGLDAKAIVIEFIRSWSSSGYTEVPTFKIIDGNNHILSEEPPEDDSDQKPEPIIVTIPYQNEKLFYTGYTQKVSLSTYNQSVIFLTGQFTGNDAGEYTLVATLQYSNAYWSDGGQESKEIKWMIRKATCFLPTVIDLNFIYDGNKHAPLISSYNALTIIVGGQLEASEIGDYMITFTPTKNYMWPEGNNETRTVHWSIKKQKGIIVLLDDNNINLTTEESNAKIHFLYEGGLPNKNTIVINNPEIISVSIELNEESYYFNIEAISTGEAEIKITTSENDIYAKSDEVIVHVKCEMESNIPSEPSTEISSKDTILPETNESYYDIIYANNKFTAIVYYSDIIVHSIDGINWIQEKMPLSHMWRSIAYGNDMYVAVGTNMDCAAYSYDGINWHRTNLSSNGVWSDVIFGDGKFVAIAYQNSIAAYSINGIEWKEVRLPISGYWYKLAYGNGRFVSVAYYSNNAVYSYDGIAWYQSFLPRVDTWNRIVYGDDKFVALPCYDGDSVAYSADGIDWKLTSLPISQSWYALAYGNGLYMAMADKGFSVIYSKDGINWQIIETAEAKRWIALAYGDGKFVAIARDSNIGIVWYIPDNF